MKTMTINIIKKNRAYFKCQGNNGFHYKLKINELSENLEPGTHELLVNDISVRTKYGTDVIYEVTTEKSESFVTLKHFKYNKNLVEECRKLGGQWDSEEKSWVFDGIVEPEVEELEYLYNSKLIDIEITVKTEDNDGMFFSQRNAEFIGYTIAIASGRDSGAHLESDIAMISGKINSAGSMKNWGTDISESSIFRLKVPELLLKDALENQRVRKGWEVKILNSTDEA